jgi:hypothetical protein
VTFRDWQRQALAEIGTDLGREALDILREWPQDKWPEAVPGEAPKKVAIIGKGHYDCLAPWGEPGWELWGLNMEPGKAGWPPVRAHTRWFQLHPPRYLRTHYPKGIDDLAHDWSEERGVPLYMDRHYEEYPDSVAYPKAEVEALWPYYGRYHTSSFDWMVALAILEGFERIELHGCEFGAYPYTLGEPISGRACLEAWLGFAAGRGTDIHVGPQHTGELFMTVHHACYRSTLQYGFEHEPALDMGKADPAWRDVR